MNTIQQPNSHIFTNKDGNTLIKEFEGVLQHNPQIRNLDAVVGFSFVHLATSLLTSFP